jgi:hypothetical protein
MEKIKLIFKNLDTISLSTIIISLLYAFSYLIFDIVFEDKDDVGIQLIAQGFYSDEPSQYLLFVNVIVGYFFKFLYSINKDIYWYSLFFVSFQFISMVLVLNYLIKQKLSIIFYILILLIFQFLIIRLQFTTVTALVLIVGYIYFKDRMMQNKSIVLPLLFIIFGYLLRIGMFLFLVYLFVIIFIFESKSIKNLYFKKQNLIPIIITGIIIGTCFYIDQLHYKNSDWSYYFSYEKERGPLNDNPMLEDYVAKKYANNPRLLSDYQLIFKFIPLKEYDNQKLAQLRIEAEKSSNLNAIARSIAYNLKLNNNIFLFIFLIPLFFYAIYKKNSLMIGTIVFTLLLFLYISSNHIFKNRLSLPIFLVFLVYFAKNLPNKFIYFISIIFVPLIFKSNIIFFNFYDKYNQNIQYPKDKPVVAINSPWKIVHPFKLNQINNQKDIFVLGWMSNTHLLRQKIEKYGIIVPPNHFSPFDDQTLNKHFYFYIDNDNTLNNLEKNLNYKNMTFIKKDGYEDIYLIKKLQ